MEEKSADHDQPQNKREPRPAVELAPEERQRIYEEEKARICAQAAEVPVADATRQSSIRWRVAAILLLLAITGSIVTWRIVQRRVTQETQALQWSVQSGINKRIASKDSDPVRLTCTSVYLVRKTANTYTGIAYIEAYYPPNFTALTPPRTKKYEIGVNVTQDSQGGVWRLDRSDLLSIVLGE